MDTTGVDVATGVPFVLPLAWGATLITVFPPPRLGFRILLDVDLMAPMEGGEVVMVVGPPPLDEVVDFDGEVATADAVLDMTTAAPLKLLFSISFPLKVTVRDIIAPLRKL